MNLKKIVLVCLVLPVFLEGCKTTQTPYEVDRKIKYQQGRRMSFYDYGITQEQVNDKIYFVTAKLDGSSSNQRAQDMWYLHAANIALDNGYQQFAVSKTRFSTWCTGTRNAQTGEHEANEAGPGYRGFVLLVKDKSQLKLKGSKKLYNGQEVKIEKQAAVEKLIDENIMAEDAKKYLQDCRDRH